jgi:hypothetical protein
MAHATGIDIDQLTEPELIDLNRRIVARLKMIAALRSHRQMMTFSVGQRVRFEPPGRGVLEGFVSRYDRKTVTLVTSGGEPWNVAPGLLRPAVAATDAVEIIDVPQHKDRA